MRATTQRSSKRQGSRSTAYTSFRRRGDHALSEEDPTGWAVSYSDMLMVMMSFFIIFFSFDDAGKKSVLDEIAITLGDSGYKVKAEAPPVGTAGAGAGAGAGLGQGGGDGRSSTTLRPQKEVIYPSLGLPESATAIASLRPQDLSAAIATTMGALGVSAQRDPETESLLLNLPPNIFNPGKFSLDKEKQATLDSILNKLKPAMSRITISFVGHSDAVQVMRGNGNYQDNFMLSSLRAWHAMQTAYKLGLPPEGMTILGAGSVLMDSRSLSIKVSQKKANQSASKQEPKAEVETSH